MLIAIRDDDTSYFTDPEELDAVYAEIPECPISLAVVPKAFPKHRDRELQSDRHPLLAGVTEYPLDWNQELVAYLRSGVASGRFEILLHGYTHEYRMIDGRWTAEYVWRPASELLQLTDAGKEYLERLLGAQVQVFVAPCNHISEAGVRAIISAGLNFSGILQHGDRPLSLRYLQNYIRRWSYRALAGCPYPFLLDFGTHRELYAWPTISYSYLERAYERCKSADRPFVINTHYWAMKNDPKVRDMVIRVVRRALREGARPAMLSECYLA